MVYSRAIKQWYIPLLCFFSLCGAGTLVYWYPQYGRYANSAISCLTAPLLTLQHIVMAPIKNYYQRSDLHALQQKIQSLADECDQLKQELVAAHASYAFVQETQELTRYKKRYALQPHILAHIVLRHLNEHEQSMIIDCGSMHGVEKDMVAVYKNALIGRVTSVYPYSSKIVLITDPLCKVAVFCAQTKASGIAEGTCDQASFALTHINHFDTLKKGDYIISSGAGLVFPKGFGLGTIQDFSPDGLFYTVTAKPLISLDRITHCYLIKKGTES